MCYQYACQNSTGYKINYYILYYVGYTVICINMKMLTEHKDMNSVTNIDRESVVQISL
jgi:hypothetical protein